MTAVSVVQHAAGIKKDGVKGAGMLGFVKYESRAISVVITALLLAGGASVATADSSNLGNTF